MEQTPTLANNLFTPGKSAGSETFDLLNQIGIEAVARARPPDQAGKIAV